MQKINLYLDEFKHIDPPYSANIMLALAIYSVLAGILVSLILASLMWWWQGELKENQKKSKVWENDLQQAKSLYPEPTVDARIVRNAETLKQNLERNRKVLKYLNTQKFGAEHQSFSVYLLALTWVTEKDLWLTDIKISNAGASLALTGRALYANALPSYLKKLSDIEVFSDMKFKVFEMTRDKKGLKFVVSSNREAEKIQSVRDLISGEN